MGGELVHEPRFVLSLYLGRGTLLEVSDSAFHLTPLSPMPPKSSLRQIKGQLNTREREQRKKTLAAVSKNEMMRLGTHPVLTRNSLMEKTWKMLLSDPPVAHSDPNQWRSAADVRPSSFPFCGRRYVMERLGLTVPSDFRVESNFYTEVGKAVHYVAQNAIARTGRLWGFSWQRLSWPCSYPFQPTGTSTARET